MLPKRDKIEEKKLGLSQIWTVFLLFFVAFCHLGKLGFLKSA
jgi:hypothetical protein